MGAGGRLPPLGNGEVAVGVEKYAGGLDFYATDGTAAGTRKLDVVPAQEGRVPEQWRPRAATCTSTSTMTCGAATARGPEPCASKTRAAPCACSQSGTMS